jgi:hypothetical protein
MGSQRATLLVAALIETRGTTRPQRQEPSNGEGSTGSCGEENLSGERATALIEDIWCEKIRGCSYGEGSTSACTPNEPPSQVVVRSDVLPTPMTGRRSIALRPGLLRQEISDSLTASDKSGQR